MDEHSNRRWRTAQSPSRESIDMDLGFKRYQETLRRTARGYLEKACGLENLRAADASEAGFSLEHYREMAALGWFALALPTAAGGGEDDFLNAMVLYEEFGRAA